MATKTDPRKLVALVGLLAVLAVVVLLRVVPAIQQGVASRNANLPPVPRVAVPKLAWDPNASRDIGDPRAGRNLFTFGAPPTPTPDLRPKPTPAPTLPPRPMPTPTPRGVLLATGDRLPEPPPFPLLYIGWLGPDRRPVGIFRDGGEIVAVPEGEQVKQRFIIREIAPNGVKVGYAGYPADFTTFVPLSR